jgi:undecaprenyl diphosphate synthase
LPVALAERIALAESRTMTGRRMHLRVAIDYSGRAAIREAARQGTLAQEQHDQAAGAGASLLPEVDLVIRTGGERRLSDFLLWESAYAELAFLDVHFPDLTTAELDHVLDDFAARERRFGDVLIKESA